MVGRLGGGNVGRRGNDKGNSGAGKMVLIGKGANGGRENEYGRVK